MLIDEFINGFNVAPDKGKYMAKHITTKYIPYETKLSLCNEINERSMWIEVNGKKVFQQNSPIRYMLFIQALLEMYTDIELTDDAAERFRVFNEVEKAGVTQYMIQCVGTDYQSFSTMLNMVYDDTVFNETNLISYIDRKIEATGITFGVIEDAIKQLVNSEIKDNGGKIVEFHKQDSTDDPIESV